MFNPGSCSRVICCAECMTVDVVRTLQHCSARLSKQYELKSASYVNTSQPEEKAEIIMNMERGGVENKTSNSCGLTMKTSLFKAHNFCIFTFSNLYYCISKTFRILILKTCNIVRIFLNSAFC